MERPQFEVDPVFRTGSGCCRGGAGHVKRTEEAQPIIQGQRGFGGGEGGTDGGPTGRPVRSPSRPDPGLEKALLDGVSGVFNVNYSKRQKSDEALVARLYQQIGQLKVERDFLAKRSGP